MMKNLFRRIGAIFLSVAMIATMLPAFTLSASAAGTLSVSDTKIGLSWKDASSSNGAAGWSVENGKIIGTATGYKMASIISTSVTTQLIITNNYSTERTLSFTYTLSNGGSVKSSVGSMSDGAYSYALAAGASMTITLTSPKGVSTNKLTISDIQLIGNSNVTATFLPATSGGSYTVGGSAVTAQVSYTKEPTASSYAVVATAASGYSFFGWYDSLSASYLGYDASGTLLVSSDASITPVFVAGNPAHFTVGLKRFYNLTDATNEAKNGSVKKIVVAKDGVVTGSHTIPAGVTLVVPYDAAGTTYGKNPSCTSYDDLSGLLMGTTGWVDWVRPTPFRTLTLGPDAYITVENTAVIEVGGQHASAAGKTGMNAGSPTGPLGYIHMQSGSHIDLNSGSTLYCWGYIYGEGTITAKNGSAIYENFQMEDFRGGEISTQMAKDLFVFSSSQYYVQNIEVATRYEYGSTEYVATSVYISNTNNTATVQFIGTNAMFRPQPGAYVIKDYDPTTDRLVLDVYGDCSLASLEMEIANTPINSADYILPINNNISITLHEGLATLEQNIMMLPGSSMTVGPDATLYIASSDVGNNVLGSSYALILFDGNNYTWGLNENFEVETDLHFNHYDTLYGMRIRPVNYTCTARKARTDADLTDVVLDINGAVVTEGYLYTTVTYADDLNGDYTIIDGGAQVISSEGTGYIEYVNGSGYDMYAMMFDQDLNGGDGFYYYIPMASAQLRNGDGSMLDTSYMDPGVYYMYCTIHDCWYMEECEQCTEACANGEHFYDDEADMDCNVCGEIRVFANDLFHDGLTSVSDGKGKGHGLAALFTVDVTGMEIEDKRVGNYDNARVDADTADGDYKLVMMGAVVSNNGKMPSLDNLDTVTNRIIDIPALKIYDATEETATFAIRVINIPDSALNVVLQFRPYYIYENNEGEQVVVYGDIVSKSYNGAKAALGDLDE